MTGMLRIGLIGTGYMGKAHTIGLQMVRAAFQPPLVPVCEMICSTTEEGAAAHAEAWGWNRSTADWRALVADPAVDAVIIATPPRTHLAMATEALRLGKPVFCE
jgi:predicted dehydrogenase